MKITKWVKIDKLIADLIFESQEIERSKIIRSSMTLNYFEEFYCIKPLPPKENLDKFIYKLNKHLDKHLELIKVTVGKSIIDGWYLTFMCWGRLQ